MARKKMICSPIAIRFYEGDEVLYKNLQSISWKSSMNESIKDALKFYFENNKDESIRKESE